MDLYVTADEMASVLVLNPLFEDLCPEPYRSNPDTTLIVRYTEYKKFIRTYLLFDNYLSTSTSALRDYVSLGNDVTLRLCFYRDIAMAVMKEIYLTRLPDRPTHIIHEIDDVSTISIDPQTMFLQQSAKARSQMIELASSYGYKVGRSKIQEFSEDIRYASFLYCYAQGALGVLPWNLGRI